MATFTINVGQAIQDGVIVVNVDLADVDAELNKIDLAAANGLSGFVDSLSYKAHETERHLHSWERWFGAAVAPNGTIHVADRIGTSVTPFQMDGANNTWGAWVQVLGSSDTPADAGMARFDYHRVFIQAVERANATHLIQVAIGASGAAALAAGTYTEFVYRPASAAAEETPVMVQIRRTLAASLIWMRVWVIGQNTGTVDFWVGIHEYEG